MLRFRALSLVVALAATCTVGAVGAPGPGLAYDSVTKFHMSTDDTATIEPGSFDDDYRTASAPQASSDTGGGGFLGKMKKAVQMAKTGVAMLSTGSAERHYVAGSKERTDMPALQTATITDCAARTITTLDLAKKTYRIESMDHPEMKTEDSHPTSTGTPSPIKDDGTKVSMVITTKALGPKTVGGQNTAGYNSDIKMTATKPTGESSTGDMNMTAYYAPIQNPTVTSCILGSTSGPAQMKASQEQMALVMKALTSKGNDRFKVTASGPPVPAGQLAMFQVMTFGSDKTQGKGFAMVTERGNVHSITASDPIFSVPADFTKEQ